MANQFTNLTGLPVSAGDPSAATTSGGPFGNLSSLVGTGLSIYDTSQAYNGLQSALNTIGPTQLSSNQLTGPGGLTTGYNPTSGAGSINLGSLNPAFSGFAGAAGGGANGYNSGLPSFLSSNAMSTLAPSMATLGGAYGNYNAGMNAAGTQLNNLGDFNTNYNNLLQAQYGQLQPQIQNQAFGLQNTLFGNGVANSSGAASGSLAEANFGRGVGQAQSTAQLNAFQQALQQQNSAATNYGTLTNSANGILANAFNNFGNTNQLISGLNTAGLNNATTAAQGAGALNTVGLNNYNAGLQSSLAAATARNQSLFPYASVASALAGQQTGLGAFGSALTQAGANGGNPIGNLFSAYNNLSSGVNPFGAYGAFGSTPDYTTAFNGAFDSSGLNNISSLGDLGFNSAGGGAAGSGVAGAGGVGAAPSLGFSGAAETTGGAAAGAGAGFAGAGGDALGTTAAAQAGASFGAGNASLLGTVSPALAMAAPAALLAWAATRPNGGTALDANYWNGVANTMNAGPGSGQFTPGTASAGSGLKQYTGYESARSNLLGDLSGGYQGVPFSNAQLASWGITPQMISSYRSDMTNAGAAGQSIAQQLGIPTTSQSSSQHK